MNKMKDSLRKSLVSVKRNPQMIPLVMLFVSFLVYSLNLTHVSDTTARIQGAGMGLCQFAIMLLSLLSMVCLLNAFPRRKKPNIPMIILMMVMFAVIIFCNITYQNAINYALYEQAKPLSPTKYITAASSMLMVHMILVSVTAVLVLTLPVYSKLLRKINTSIAVEDNGDMAQIEITD